MIQSITPLQLYKGDTWLFTVTATDGAPLIGGTSLIAGGIGYTSAPTVTFSAPTVAGGRAATGTAVVAVDTSIASITITDRGYYPAGSALPFVVLTGGAGTGALFNAILGNPINLTGCTGGAELFTNNVTVIDLTSLTSIPTPVNGVINTQVDKATSNLCAAQVPPLNAYPTRLHIYYTLGAQRFTVAVIPIIPTAP